MVKILRIEKKLAIEFLSTSLFIAKALETTNDKSQVSFNDDREERDTLLSDNAVHLRENNALRTETNNFANQDMIDKDGSFENCDLVSNNHESQEDSIENLNILDNNQISKNPIKDESDKTFLPILTQQNTIEQFSKEETIENIQNIFDAKEQDSGMINYFFKLLH